MRLLSIEDRDRELDRIALFGDVDNVQSIDKICHLLDSLRKWMSESESPDERMRARILFRKWKSWLFSRYGKVYRNDIEPIVRSRKSIKPVEVQSEVGASDLLAAITTAGIGIGQIGRWSEDVDHVAAAELTAEIVAAYVSNNEIAPSDLAMLINSVGIEIGKVTTVVETEPPAEEKPEPAVSVRRSVQPNQLICLVCGKPQKVLKRHLAVQHNLTPAQYRERFELKADYPMVAPNYAQQRREVALQTGLGRPKRPARRRRKAGTRAQKPELGWSAAATTRS